MISVIILSMNNGDTLEACLKSVLRSPPFNKEVIVVDAHSKDNTKAILEKYRDRIRVIYDEGKGIGLARNIGVKHATYEIVAFLDSDVICAKDHFITLLNCFKNHSEIGAADIIGSHPQIGTKIQRLESLYRQTIEKYFKGQSTLRGWSISFRKKAWRDIGGFWPGGPEDKEFSHKLLGKGYKITSLKSASWHIPRPTVIGMWKEQSGWGRMSAYYNYMGSKNPLLLEELHSRNRLFRSLRSVTIMIVITYMLAPLTGLKYLFKTKNLSLYFYFLFVHAAFLVGYVRGTQMAPKRFKKEQREAAALR